MFDVIAVVRWNTFQASRRGHFKSIQSDERAVSHSNGGNALRENQAWGPSLRNCQSGLSANQIKLSHSCHLSFGNSRLHRRLTTWPGTLQSWRKSSPRRSATLHCHKCDWEIVHNASESSFARIERKILSWGNWLHSRTHTQSSPTWSIRFALLIGKLFSTSLSDENGIKF